ncbi:hypothetical protein HDU79_011394 [Rhizoclosmatium sp. JEL0117]|nr:hypothetical protein HDU79_011394 [Rhizoclosmatium sp. JEL0117]
MKFSGQILVRLVVPIVLGFLLIGLCAMVLFFAKVPGEIDNIQARLEANEYSHFGNNAAGAAKLVDNIFSDFAVQITAAATQARNVLGLDGSSEDPKVPTASIYPSYFAGQLDGVDPPLPPNPLDVSAYFNVNITTLAQFKAMQPDITANLDNVFRSAVVNQPRIRGIQIAFPDGGWRIYPLVYNLSTFNPLNNTFCNGEDVAPEFRGSAGFKPICRQFYLTAINAYPPSKPGPPNGITPAVFTKPYPSAITGQLLVGASISLYKNKQFYGVISLQILVASLANKLANTPILNNGYIYIIEVFLSLSLKKITILFQNRKAEMSSYILNPEPA